MNRRRLTCCTVAALLLAALAPVWAQVAQLRHANDFTSDIYFDPPNEQQVKIRLHGGAADPLPGGALDVRDLKIEYFDTHGHTQGIMTAPQCNYQVLDGIANSTGHIEFRTGDDRMVTTGEGFLWQESDNSLIISNHVHTVIKSSSIKFSLP